MEGWLYFTKELKRISIVFLGVYGVVFGSGIMTFREYTALGNGGRSGGKLVLNSGTLYCLEFLGNVPGNVNTEVRYYARQCYGGRIADAFSKVTLTANPAEGCVFT